MILLILISEMWDYVSDVLVIKQPYEVYHYSIHIWEGIAKVYKEYFPPNKDIKLGCSSVRYIDHKIMDVEEWIINYVKNYDEEVMLIEFYENGEKYKVVSIKWARRK